MTIRFIMRLLPGMAAVMMAGLLGSVAWASSFDLNISIPSPGSFTAGQLQVLEAAIDDTEALWEGVITGYQPDINITSLAISVVSGSSFADATVNSSVDQGGFHLSTSGTIRINPLVIDAFGSWDGSGPVPANTEFMGVNYIDELISHEVGHVLGIGTQWSANVAHTGYVNGTNAYTGAYGLAAYRADYNASATYVPVETAGSAGTMFNHWDQLMRSSSQEGDPSDPWSLSPLVGITDTQGRDLALELMTGAIDPDYGEPYLSRMTVQSLRDLGFTVVPEPTSMALLAFACLMLASYNRRIR